MSKRKKKSKKTLAEKPVVKKLVEKTNENKAWYEAYLADRAITPWE